MSSLGEESENRGSVGVFFMDEVEHTCSITESGYQILGNGNKHSFSFDFNLYSFEPT